MDDIRLPSKTSSKTTPIDADILPIVDTEASNAFKNITLANIRDNYLVDDAGTDTTDIWSASKITSELAGKSESSHTHNASEIDAGTLTHERGGLEADVSAYSGLVKITGGATSAVGTVKTSSWSSDEDKIPTLWADGKLASGFISSIDTPNIIYWDGSDWNVTISSNTSITRDMYYDNLTIETGCTLSPAGFRVFVKGTLTLEWTGKISANGSAGGAGWSGANGTAGWHGAGGSAGSAGAVVWSSASLPAGSPWEAGTAGTAGSGSSQDGVVGTAGDSVAKALWVAWSAWGLWGGGGNFNTPSTDTAAGWAAGAISGTVFNKPNSLIGAYALFDTMPSISTLTVSAWSGSGGWGWGGQSSWAGDYGGWGGGWGWSGSTGWIVWVASRNIVTVDWNDYISADGWVGGNGWNGWDGYSDAGGGGGGGWGAGWSGWVAIVIYGTKTGTGTISVDWWAGGTWGTAWLNQGSANNDPDDWGDGTAWNTWTTYVIEVS